MQMKQMKTIAQKSALPVAITAFAAAAPFALTGGGMASNSAVVTTMAHSQVVVGDHLAAVGEFAAARQAYDIAAKMIRSQGQVPIEASRRVANAYYYEGHYRSAVETLDRLANEAAVAGDPVAECLALSDAAWMARLDNSQLDAELGVKRVKKVRSAPSFAAESREEIESTLEHDLTVFSPHLETR